MLSYTQTKQILDRLKRLCVARDLPDSGAYARFDETTRQGEDMRWAQGCVEKHLAFAPGGRL